jgi:adenosylcobinamide-phosphate synthase
MIDPLLQVFIALALDGCIGDPRRLPHPVRLIGRAALALETPARRLIRSPWWAGIATTAVVVGGTLWATWAVLAMARWVSPLVGDLFAIWLFYTAFATRDLADHATAVSRRLAASDLNGARTMVARLVGRDTNDLTEAGVVRATVESVAENTVDGVIAPLFFAFCFGPPGAMAFKAVSTLDSIFGYKNARYLQFGWASARLDDLANYLPARFGLLCIAVASACMGGRFREVMRIALRDRGRHASPNAGYPEAAFAAALAVQLGGPVTRNGVSAQMPLMGDALEPLAPRHIPAANHLMITTTLVAAISLTAAAIVWRAVI